MQGGHRLARADAAGDLSWPCVPWRIGDLQLRRMEEDAPGCERVLKDAVEFVVPLDENDTAGGTFHGCDDVAGIDRLPRRILRDFCPDLLGSLAAGKAQEHGVLRVGDHVLHRVQVRFGREQPGDCPRVLVDAETGHVGIADVCEQPLAGCPGRPFKRRLDLLERSLVPNFDDAESLVHSETVASCVSDRLVIWKDLEEAVGIPCFGGENHAAPGLVDADCADPVVLAPGDLLQVQSGVHMLGELVDGCLRGVLYWLRQL